MARFHGRRWWRRRAEASEREAPAHGPPSEERTSATTRAGEGVAARPPPVERAPPGERPLERRAERPGIFDRPTLDTVHLDRLYHDFLAVRRLRRFAMAGLLLLGITILGVVWLVNGAMTADTVMLALTTNQLLGGVVVVLLVGLVAAWAAGRGNLAGLMVAWLAGLLAFIVALAELPQWAGFPAVTQVLVALLGVLGLGCLVAATLAIASWRGGRVQDRILAGVERRRRITGRAI